MEILAPERIREKRQRPRASHPMGNRMQGGQRRREVSVERGSLGAIAGPASTRMASSARTPEAMPTAGLRKKEAKIRPGKGNLRL